MEPTLEFTPRKKGTITLTPKTPEADGPPLPPLLQLIQSPKPSVPWDEQNITA